MLMIFKVIKIHKGIVYLKMLKFNKIAFSIYITGIVFIVLAGKPASTHENHVASAKFQARR